MHFFWRFTWTKQGFSQSKCSYFQCSGENAMNSRKICIGHKDWKLSYAVYPVSQTCSLIPSILSCDCQGVENLTTKSREKYRTQLLPWGVLPSCFCSCINILVQAPVCGGVTASLCSRMEVPSWYVLSQGGQFRCQWGLSHLLEKHQHWGSRYCSWQQLCSAGLSGGW